MHLTKNGGFGKISLPLYRRGIQLGNLLENSPEGECYFTCYTVYSVGHAKQPGLLRQGSTTKGGARHARSAMMMMSAVLLHALSSPHEQTPGGDIIK